MTEVKCILKRARQYMEQEEPLHIAVSLLYALAKVIDIYLFESEHRWSTILYLRKRECRC